MGNRLGNNPLFDAAETFNAETEREYLDADLPKRGRKRNESIIRENGSQKGLTDGWTRATFIIEVEQLNLLKDYAYTQRLKMKEVMQMVIERFIEQEIDPLKDSGKLLKHK